MLTVDKVGRVTIHSTASKKSIDVVKPIIEKKQTKRIIRKKKKRDKRRIETKKVKLEGNEELKKVMKAARKIWARSNPGTSREGFLPSDPNALCKRLELLMASKQVGNTVRNEIVSICDELLRQKILPRDAYKNLMLTLNKW